MVYRENGPVSIDAILKFEILSVSEKDFITICEKIYTEKGVLCYDVYVVHARATLDTPSRMMSDCYKKGKGQ